MMSVSRRHELGMYALINELFWCPPGILTHVLVHDTRSSPFAFRTDTRSLRKTQKSSSELAELIGSCVLISNPFLKIETEGKKGSHERLHGLQCFLKYLGQRHTGHVVNK